MADQEGSNSTARCNICGADDMKVKDLVLTYQEPGKEEVTIEIQGEVCDSCDEIILRDEQ